LISANVCVFRWRTSNKSHCIDYCRQTLLELAEENTVNSTGTRYDCGISKYTATKETEGQTAAIPNRKDKNKINTSACFLHHRDKSAALQKVKKSES
jgi:hypothetical protein